MGRPSPLGAPRCLNSGGGLVLEHSELGFVGLEERQCKGPKGQRNVFKITQVEVEDSNLL